MNAMQTKVQPMNWGIDWLMTLPALWMLGILVFVDFVFGTAVATAKKELASMWCWIGWLKKISMFVGVGLGFCVEILYINYKDIVPYANMPSNAPIAVLFAMAFCWMEILSISEKIKRSGLKLPWIMRVVLDRLKQAVDGPPNGITLPNVTIGHLNAHDVKMDSDIHPKKVQLEITTPSDATLEIADRVAERRAKRTEDDVKQIKEQQQRDSETIATIDEHTRPPAN